MMIAGSFVFLLIGINFVLGNGPVPTVVISGVFMEGESGASGGGSEDLEITTNPQQEITPTPARVTCPVPFRDNSIDYMIEVGFIFYLPGTRIHYFCNNENHIIMGDPILTCKPDGQWDNEFPFCVLG